MGSWVPVIICPELRVLGAAIGGTIVNLSSVTFTIKESIFAGFIPTAVVGLVNAYTSLTDLLNEPVIPSTVAASKRPGMHLISYLSEGRPEWPLAAAGWGNYINRWHKWVSTGRLRSRSFSTRLSGLRSVPWQTTTILFPSIVPKVFNVHFHPIFPTSEQRQEPGSVAYRKFARDLKKSKSLRSLENEYGQRHFCCTS